MNILYKNIYIWINISINECNISLLFLQSMGPLTSIRACVLIGQLGQWKKSDLMNTSDVSCKNNVCYRWVFDAQQCWIHLGREPTVLLGWLIVSQYSIELIHMMLKPVIVCSFKHCLANGYHPKLHALLLPQIYDQGWFHWCIRLST